MATDKQRAVSKWWVEYVQSPEVLTTERNWAKWVRIKFEALVEAGFNEDQALEIVKGTFNITNNSINLGKFEPED